MQRFVSVALLLIAMALARPQEQPAQEVTILKHDSFINPSGYQFSFETSDGTSRQEQGTLKQISDDHQAIEVQGSYQYTAPDGLIYSVSYTADENGYKPQSHVEQAGSQ